MPQTPKQPAGSLPTRPRRSEQAPKRVATMICWISFVGACCLVIRSRIQQRCFGPGGQHLRQLDHVVQLRPGLARSRAYGPWSCWSPSVWPAHPLAGPHDLQLVAASSNGFGSLLHGPLLIIVKIHWAPNILLTSGRIRPCQAPLPVSVIFWQLLRAVASYIRAKAMVKLATTPCATPVSLASPVKNHRT